MAHIMIRKYQTKDGLKWTATEATFDSAKRSSTEKKIEPLALEALGFSLNMTPDQARAHAKKLNALNAIERKEHRTKVRAAERLHDLVLVENSIVPTEMSDLFIDHIKMNWHGGEYNLRKQIQHWSTVQEVITVLKLQPHEYNKRKNELYKHFQACRYGRSYVEKLLRVMNLWGEFYAEKTKTYFKKVSSPRGIILENIKTASGATGLGAAPLTPEILTLMKGKMPPGQWEYLRATLWLGLRPSDLDGVIANREANLDSFIQDGTRIIGVYQPKLVTVPEEQRWKWVPSIHPEQDAAFKDINMGILDKPLVKTVRAYAPAGSGNLGLYSGRKGFTDLMLSLGQSLEDISQWMGHASIERTWKHYKNKRRVSFKKIN